MRKIAFRYGLYMFIGFTAFFLIMYAIGQSANINLRIFNSIIHLSLMAFAIRDYRVKHRESLYNHVSGVAMGMYASFYGVVGFAIFMFLFLALVPSVMENINQIAPLDFGLNPVSAAAFIFVEGIATSLIGAYILGRVVDMNMVDEKKEESTYHS